MKTLTAIITTAAILVAVSCRMSERTSESDIIPQPKSCEFDGRFCDISSLNGISADMGLENECRKLRDALEGAGLAKKIVRRGDIRLKIDSGLKDDEAYRLKVEPGRITISGGTQAGIFYGIVSLYQEMNAGKVRCGRIYDSPRFGWRGLMLDEARHFFGEEKVRQILDLMAYYKLNRFHWHLTDAQGWRLEIRKYPLLTEVGGIGTHSDRNAPAQFYTQEQVRKIVEYAKERHIEIIPEIDMPGHATAAVRAYPQFNGGGSKDNPDFTFNVGKEGTRVFLSDILREVSELFPGRYIHIGGDEVAFGSEAWNTNADIQELIRCEGLDGLKGAEGYFMNSMADSVKMMGKEVFGWDDMLEYDLTPDKCRIMWWRHDKPEQLQKALDKGFDVVLCPRRPLYLDFIQHSTHKFGRTWAGFCPIEDIYAFPDSLPSAAGQLQGSKQVLGVQANVWTEKMQCSKRLDFMMFPRICALAESAWTEPEHKNFRDFSRRMEYSYRLFDKAGIYYFDTRDPQRHPEPEGPQM